MEENKSHISAPVAMSGSRKLGALSAEDVVVSMFRTATTRRGWTPSSHGHGEHGAQQ